MASGRVILSTTGIQDEFLTGDPQMTYFLKQFKRHTRFAMETAENPIDGTVDFGNTLSATIPRKGDIIRNLSIKIELSDITADYGTPVYTDSIGHALIEYCDLVIGGQTIERITGEYMEIFSELCVSNSQQDAYYYLVGKSRDQTITGGNNIGRRVYIVTLPFYFFRNNQLGIPLYSIYRQEVELKFKFRPLLDVDINSDNINTLYTPDDNVSASILRSGILTDYVYLTDEEKNYIKARPTDYVIEQLQLSRGVIENTENSKTFKLNFTNPVKELYIVVQNQDTQDKNDWFNFKFENALSSTSNSFIDTIQLEFNNEIMISKDVADCLYLLYAQPMYHHTRVPKRNIYSYSFALRPEDPEPPGQVNMSRIINKLLKVTMNGEYGQGRDNRNIRIYAKNYNVLRIQDGLAGLLFIDNTFM